MKHSFLLQAKLLPLFLFIVFQSFAQSSNHTPGSSDVTAQWIAAPATAPHAYGVYHFRKDFSLSSLPAHFTIYVSADPRYRLYVNGISVCTGPARGDSLHWKMDSIDILQYLHPGANLIAATVWNDGEDIAWAQLSVRTGFFLRGISAGSAIVNTDSTWRAVEDHAYSPAATIAHITGANEQVFSQRYPWGWQTSEFDDSAWPHALAIDDGGRRMVMRDLPFPEEVMQRIPSIRSVINGPQPGPGFLQGSEPLQIGPWTNTRILVDQDELTTAYPEILVSGGKGASITLTYAESLYEPRGGKGNRNEVTGKDIKGDKDIFLPDGGQNRLFSPLSYRTYRYIELHIENHQQPLTIQDFRGRFTAYPFRRLASFETGDTLLTAIWNTAWRTARLCAYETYMDCPYYEQLQYVGDTRIQALISLYVTGDDRLMKNAIRQIYHSMLPEGITQSRYPSNMRQIIPPFSLFWIAMLNDYWMLRRDDAFLQECMPGVKKILDWHEKYITEQGLCGAMPYWNFVDWTSQWPWRGKEETSGVPDGALTGGSSILTLQYVMALQKAAALYGQFGAQTDQQRCLSRASRSLTAVRTLCWNPAKRLLAETPGSEVFSQHAQALGVLTGCFSPAEQIDIMHRVLPDSSLIQCSYYYRFYLLQALKKAGLADEYLHQLGPWKKMLDAGLTTFAEAPEPTRSDCHAWSASPAYDFLATVCGIIPASPGFRTVRIEPHPGSLTHCHGSMPHPDGTIAVQYDRDAAGHWNIAVDLPERLKGDFVWKGRSYKLHPGANHFLL